VTASDRPFLLEGNPLLQRFFALPRPAFLAVAATPGTMMLLLGLLAGVASIPVEYPEGDLEDVGIWWQANWSLAYLLLVPALLFATRLLSSRIEQSIFELEEIEVIVPSADHEGGSLTSEIRQRFSKHARLLTVAFLVVTAVLLVADTQELVTWTRAHLAATATGETCGPTTTEMDWSTAFADRACWGDVRPAEDFVPVRVDVNLAFNSFAYLVQALWIFLALLMISKIGLFFFYMADYFGRDEGQFRIEPLWDDPLRRLGLTSLGNIYNLMLTMLLLFEGYVVLRRLQQIALTQQTSILTYVRELTLAVSDPSRWLDPDLLQLSSVDFGMWFSILIVGPVVFMICWFPLFKIRNYIEQRRVELTKEYARELKRAKESGDDAAIAAFDRRARALDSANVWPNGDRAAWRFLYAMIALWVGSIVPMAFIILATLFAVPEVLGLLAELVNRVLHKRAPASAFPE